MDEMSALINRRRFLQGAALASAAAALAACNPASSTSSITPASVTSPRATKAPSSALSVTSPHPTPDSAAQILVRDVVDFDLRGPYKWNGGSVTMRLHEGRLDGQPIYFIRTDVSDEALAREVGLVFAPLLRLALYTEGAVGRIFLFDDSAADGQVSVLSTGPGRDDFTPLYRVNRLTFGREARLLESAAAVDAAIADGTATLHETDIVVNYPVVKWPAGELSVDPLVEKPLEGGPLLAAPDIHAMTVTFKLHQCFPESRYIVTDTSAVAMAPMMNIPGSPRTAGLGQGGVASRVTVFGNGLRGPGAMGYQPAIFRERPGDPYWSPIWDHFTALWSDESKAVLLRSQADINIRVAAGEIQRFPGAPGTSGRGFVVNCPSPIVAPNDFEVTR